MADLRPSLSPALAAFGVAATVTPLNGAPVLTTVIDAGRATPPAVGFLGMAPSGAVDLRKSVAIARIDVPTLPVGSTILADLDGAGARNWRVDRVDSLTPDEYRAFVS